MPLLCSKLQQKLPDTLKEKFAEKGVIVDVVVKTEAEEAAYFFTVIEE
jgi:hypothetical protein